MSVDILLAGWDKEDILYCQNEITELSANYSIALIPYNNFTSCWRTIGSFNDVDAGASCSIKSDMKDLMENISAEDYEQMMIQLTRTIYNKAPMYRKLEILRAMIQRCEIIIANAKGNKTIVVYRDWPHLLSDYIFYVTCKRMGIKTFVLLPVKGLCSGFREAWAPTGKVFYIVHDLVTRRPIKLESNSNMCEELIRETFNRMINSNGCHEGKADQEPLEESDRHNLVTTRNEHERGFKASRDNDRRLVHTDSVVEASGFLADLKRVYDNISCDLKKVEYKCKSQNVKFIYFPLPKEPEANVNPAMGGNWSFVYWLDRVVKETNYLVVCKEHPDTFKFSLIHCGHFLNDKDFPRHKSIYTKIIKGYNGRVVFVDYRAASSLIMSSMYCECVFTMNGSAIYESGRNRRDVYLPEGHWATGLDHCSEISNLGARDAKDRVGRRFGVIQGGAETEGLEDNKQLYKYYVRVYGKDNHSNTLVDDIAKLLKLD